MFENSSFIYYFTIVYFAFGLPFALFSTIMSFYYFFSWTLSRKNTLFKAFAYCFVDGAFSLVFSSVGIWLVINEVANIWLIFLIAGVIDIPRFFIARKMRLKFLKIKPANKDTPTYT